MVRERAWINKSAYGGTSAPSLGYSGGVRGVRSMFVTFGETFCAPRGRLPGPGCGQPGPWVIQNRWVCPPDNPCNSIVNWGHASPASPLEQRETAE